VITAREVSYGVFGAWRLAHLDPRGMQYFDQSIEGFWRSFWAAALMAPPYALLVMLKLGQRQHDWDPVRVVLIEAIGYAIAWAAFPLVVWYLLAALGKQQRFIPYIVAYNWSSVIPMAVMLPVTALSAAGGLPEPLAGIVFFSTLAAVLFYRYFVARVALETDVLTAAGLVLLDLMLDLVRHGVVNALEMR
jgi:hypothetical protein